MHLNSLKPQVGAKKAKIRVGRGSSAGRGKTCGRGVKGQHARSGGLRKIHFEGGQMPLHRRLPKFGFTTIEGRKVKEIKLYHLNAIKDATIDMDTLRECGLISHKIETVRIINAGKLESAKTIKHLYVTKGAKSAIEAAGGSVVA